ncbi:tetratricopeptide repeat-containing sensor histidine kinase [Zunongwangia profunda]|uniref:tetratricopeptide repeat-containing sensor histidine kinase n=1 Tax=Zunongwangia profunda TaxID=398743 RepID=UPI001D194F5E|nr:tetratricopeptide repeat-containing sensor histidine kinase [Zunongwangia profunda]MCC4227941.1 tetratricopeptide repeat protein [Zunongwangia profunda]
MNPNKYIFLFLAVIIFSCKEKDIAPRYYSNSKAVQLFKESKKANNDPLKTILLEKALEEIISEEDTIKPFIYDHLIYYNNKLRNYEQSLFYANALIENSSEIQDTAKLALGYYRKAMVQKHLDNQLEVLKNLYKSQNLYLTSKDSLNAGKRLVELGIAQYRLGDFNGSQASQVKALELLDDHIDSTYAVSIYSNLASSYRQLNDLEEAIDEYKNALVYSKSKNDSLTVLNNIANIYTDLEEYDEALSIFENIITQTDNNYVGYRIKDNYYFTQWLNDQQLASLDGLELVLMQRLKNNDQIGLMASYDHLTQVYQKEQPIKALNYAEKYYEQAKATNNPTDQIRALKYMITLAPAENAQNYSLRFIQLDDSLIDARSKAKNVFAKIKYDEEQKLEQINSLEKLSAQQQIALLKSSNQRNIAIFLGILIIGASGFVIYYIRQKAKKKRIREIHKTEARISKRIHDELANDLYRLMTALENLNAPEKLELLDKLEDIYFRTRDISRENLPVKTNQEYSKEVQDMLSQMTPKSAHIYLIGIQEVNWDKISEEAKITIFRVLQELMVNMKKHSKASIISFNFKTENAKLQINYNDNGIGLQVNTLKKGKGLENVENRIESIGGSFNFQSGNQGGFSVELIIPL